MKIKLRSWLAQCVPLVASVVVLAAVSIGAAYLVPAAETKAPAKEPAAKQPDPAVKKLVKPKGWPERHPLPLVGSNCVSCHLTAGRELTAAAINFTRSIHDINDMTCYDCHGGHASDDVKAHEDEFGFIGTKKSAHIARCTECHAEAAELLASGPHAWDFGKKINTEYPMCFDCHGNHDIGNPPADFKLSAMCADCHDKPEKEFPNLAGIVKQNDRLWAVLRGIHKKNLAKAENPVPPAFREEVDALRSDTMKLIHTSKEVSAAEAETVNKRAEVLRTRLEMWLQSAK